MVYLVAGQLNLHKSNVCGGDFVRYLHDLGKKYRLSEFGSVIGMDHYGIISKDTREKQLLRIRQHVNQREPKGKKQPINALYQIIWIPLSAHYGIWIWLNA